MKNHDGRAPLAMSNEETPLLAQALKYYLQANKRKYASMTAFGRATGLSRHTIMQVCNGTLTNISSKTRTAIFAATGLREFSPFPEGDRGNSKTYGTGQKEASLDSDLAGIRAAADDVVRRVVRIQSVSSMSSELPQMGPVDGLSVAQHVERVRQVLTALDRELGFFKELEREEARGLLRERIHARDIGYVIALLRALYSKEEFDNWVLASGYGMKRNGGS